MALKDVINSLKGKERAVEKMETAVTPMASDAFPIVRVNEAELSRYNKVPLAGLATVGAAFAQLPEAARTITKTVNKTVVTDTPLFRGIWPKGVVGTMTDQGLGFSGNIVGKTQGGSSGIVGRMRYKLIEDGLNVTQTTTTIVPFDPMTMAIAAALFSIDQKLTALQEKTEEILQFLKLEKQSRQRGNLNMLAEIMEEYKRDCTNEKMCSLRVVAVQAIKREAHQDILFYQEQISRRLKEQKWLHSTQDSQALLTNVTTEFNEYQLACYLYGYAAFLEIILQKTFEPGALETVKKKMMEYAQRYAVLYEECHAKIAEYQRSSFESVFLNGLSNITRAAGTAIANMPVLGDGQLDEALIGAGESLRRRNREAVEKKLEQFETLQEDRLTPFVDSIQTLDVLYNYPNGMLTDGDYLYILNAT